MSILGCVGAGRQNGAIRVPPATGGAEKTKRRSERVGGGGGPGRDEREDAKVERMRRWLQRFGHDDCNLRLERWPRNSDAPGYGMVAGPGGVGRSDAIVRVPQEAFMTEETAMACPYVGPIAETSQLTPWQTMCLHLLCERARGERSPWYPYIALLPSELQMAGSHPMLWPQRMRRDWLAGSPMLDTTEQRLHLCREDHEAMLGAGANNLVLGAPGSGGLVTELAVRWAAVILLSRSFSLDSNEQMQRSTGPCLALVPWADMLNHNSAAGKESCLVYDSHTRMATLRAHRAYQEGEQVYDSYGPNLSPSQLLVDYGFVDEENQNHAVGIPAQVLGPVKGRLNELLLEAVGLPYRGSVFMLTPSGVDESVLSWTRAAVASPRELANAGWKEDTPSSLWQHHGASTAMAKFSQPINRENEAEVLRRLIWASEDLLRQYPTKIEEDVTALTASDGNGTKVVPLPWARKQAVRALMSEKTALIGAHRSLWDHLVKLRSGHSVHSLYSK